MKRGNKTTNKHDKKTPNKAQPAKPKPEAPSKKLSALDAAAHVLAKNGKPMTAQELILSMAEKNLWASPGGKTPHATLYAAMIREIGSKGKDARFRKVERGLFTINA